MEELLVVGIQFAVEVGLQMLGGVWLDLAAELRWSHRSGGLGKWWPALFAACGAVCGAASVAFAPHLVLPYSWLRLANLAVSPLAAGGLSYAAARRGWFAQDSVPRHHFWRGFCFALAFGLVRLAYADR